MYVSRIRRVVRHTTLFMHIVVLYCTVHLLVGVYVRSAVLGHILDANGARVKPPLWHRLQNLADLLVLSCERQGGSSRSGGIMSARLCA